MPQTLPDKSASSLPAGVPRSHVSLTNWLVDMRVLAEVEKAWGRITSRCVPTIFPPSIGKPKGAGNKKSATRLWVALKREAADGNWTSTGIGTMKNADQSA